MTETAKNKICPVFSCQNNKDKFCKGTKCAWWCQFAKDCSVPLLAGMFADSHICATRFEEVEEHE